jgi:hypothetical protein
MFYFKIEKNDVIYRFRTDLNSVIFLSVLKRFYKSIKQVEHQDLSYDTRLIGIIIKLMFYLGYGACLVCSGHS